MRAVILLQRRSLKTRLGIEEKGSNALERDSLLSTISFEDVGHCDGVQASVVIQQQKTQKGKEVVESERGGRTRRGSAASFSQPLFTFVLLFPAIPYPLALLTPGTQKVFPCPSG